MKVQIIEVKQFDPYNKLVTLDIKDDSGLLGGAFSTKHKTIKVLGSVNHMWHYWPSLERVPIDIEYALSILADELIIKVVEDKLP